MDAVRLIAVGRHALARAGEAPEIMAEAWQAQALAQAIGGRLAVEGPLELRGEAESLGEVGSRGCGVLEGAGPGPGGVAIRAARLTEVSDARRALIGLGVLLGEVGIALVAVACAADEDGLYWQCIEAMDAADESGDRVRGMLRRLSLREQSLPGGVYDPSAGSQ